MTETEIDTLALIREKALLLVNFYRVARELNELTDFPVGKQKDYVQCALNRALGSVAVIGRSVEFVTKAEAKTAVEVWYADTIRAIDTPVEIRKSTSTAMLPMELQRFVCYFDMGLYPDL